MQGAAAAVDDVGTRVGSFGSAFADRFPKSSVVFSRQSTGLKRRDWATWMPMKIRTIMLTTAFVLLSGFAIPRAAVPPAATRRRGACRQQDYY